MFILFIPLFLCCWIAADFKIFSNVRDSKGLLEDGGIEIAPSIVGWEDPLDTMVEDLKSPSVIAYPDFDFPFTVHCDASQLGLGAALYQK